MAREAGVSRALVSLVVRGEPHVRPDKQRAVRAAIERLGYRPHNAAAQLAGKRTQSVGVLVPDLINPWYGMIISALQTAARAAGLRTVFAAGLHGDGTDAERDRARDMLAGRADALILVSPRLSEADLIPLAATSPICVVGRPVTEPSVSAVHSDGHAGGALAAEHLRRRGAASLAYVAPLGPSAETIAQQRADGFVAEAKRHGQPVVTHDVPVDAGPAELAELVEKLVASGVDGIATHNDQLALAVLTTLAAEGLRGIVGFDNTPLAAYPSIALTSVDQLVLDLAEAAIGILAELSTGGQPQHLMLQPALAERST